MSSKQKRVERNTIVSVIIMIAILIIGSITLKSLLAPKDNTSKTPSTTTLKDGTYTAQSPEPSNGYTGVVTMEVKGGKIVSLVYDSLDEQGQSKRYLSSVGEYVMVEGNPTWEEQADLLAKHVIENQSLDKLTMDDSGKTDAVSGVSINISEFVNLTKEVYNKLRKEKLHQLT